jgi:hypothetical protein
MFSWLWRRLWGASAESREDASASASASVKAPVFSTPGPTHTAVSDEASSTASVSSLSPYPYLTPPDFSALSDAKDLFKVRLAERDPAQSVNRKLARQQPG